MQAPIESGNQSTQVLQLPQVRRHAALSFLILATSPAASIRVHLQDLSNGLWNGTFCCCCRWLGEGGALCGFMERSKQMIALSVATMKVVASTNRDDALWFRGDRYEISWISVIILWPCAKELHPGLMASRKSTHQSVQSGVLYNEHEGEHQGLLPVPTLKWR